MGTALYLLGAFCARRRRTVLLAWLLIVAAIVGCGVMFAGSFQSSSSIPGSPAETALMKMDQHFPSPDYKSAQVVFQAPPGHQISSAALLQPVEASLAAARLVPGRGRGVGPDEGWDDLRRRPDSADLGRFPHPELPTTCRRGR